jgi:hypothetical protein
VPFQPFAIEEPECMTKSWEKGRNVFTELAKRQASRTGEDVREILMELLLAAKTERDSERRREIEKALKYFRDRNRQKRKRRS